MKNRFLTILIVLTALLSSCSNELAEYSYYKNLPESSGTTRDDPPLFFIIKVDLGYEWGDKKTQYSLAELKPVINDGMRNLLSSKSAADFTIENEEELKQEIMEMVNSTIHRYDSFKNVPGVKTVAIVKKQVFEFR
ncbi:MAG: flagellar basal body-associated FliL family protein [Spirochaetales bacterium]|nr:flagellar basal body-associated FliL family protein [Spirochaetales bacterium]